MAFYWRVVAVYAGHLARALRTEPPRRNQTPPATIPSTANTEHTP